MGKRTKKRKMQILRNRLLVTFLLIISIFILNSINNDSKEDEGIIIDSKDNITETSAEINEDVINVLILGVDINDSNSNSHSRSDTIMVASLDQKNNKASLISIPRDTRTVIKGRKYKEKINHAHAYGGIDLTIDTVESLLNIPIHNYVKLDYIALEKIIDEIGGVELEVPIDMKYSDPYADPPLEINLKKGVQTLSGKEAIQFVRFRKGYSDQDLGRIGSQQYFMKMVLEEIVKPQNILKTPKLIDIFMEYTETDISKTKIFKYAFKAFKIKPSEISMTTLPGSPKLINGTWYYETKTEEIESLMNSRFIN